MKKIFFVLSTVALAGCGSVNDSLDSVKSMSNRMSILSSQMDAMKAQIEKTNAGTSSLKHLMVMSDALQALIKSDNTRYLVPVPYDILAFGETMSAEATSEELVKFTEVNLSKIENGQVDGPNQPTPEQLNHERLATLMALESLAGLTPVGTFQDIIATQLSGHYPSAAYSYIVLRNNFLNKIMLRGKYLSRDFGYVGEADMAVAYADQMDTIASLPANVLTRATVSITSFVPSPDVYASTVDKADMAWVWHKINRSLGRDDFYQQAVGDPLQDVSKLAALKAHAKERDSFWNP